MFCGQGRNRIKSGHDRSGTPGMGIEAPQNGCGDRIPAGADCEARNRDEMVSSRRRRRVHGGCGRRGQGPFLTFLGLQDVPPLPLPYFKGESHHGAKVRRSSRRMTQLVLCSTRPGIGRHAPTWSGCGAPVHNHRAGDFYFACSRLFFASSVALRPTPGRLVPRIAALSLVHRESGVSHQAGGPN